MKTKDASQAPPSYSASKVALPSPIHLQSAAATICPPTQPNHVDCTRVSSSILYTQALTPDYKHVWTKSNIVTNMRYRFKPLALLLLMLIVLLLFVPSMPLHPHRRGGHHAQRSRQRCPHRDQPRNHGSELAEAAPTTSEVSMDNQMLWLRYLCITKRIAPCIYRCISEYNAIHIERTLRLNWIYSIIYISKL